MAKICTSMRMKKDTLNWIDKKVKECVFANRTHAIEYALRQLMNQDRL